MLGNRQQLLLQAFHRLVQCRHQLVLVPDRLDFPSQRFLTPTGQETRRFFSVNSWFVEYS